MIIKPLIVSLILITFPRSPTIPPINEYDKTRPKL